MEREEDDVDPMLVDGEGMHKRRMLAKDTRKGNCDGMTAEIVAGPTYRALGKCESHPLMELPGFGEHPGGRCVTVNRF